MTHHVFGTSTPVETGLTTMEGNGESCTVKVEGTYADLETLNPLPYVPSGYEFDSKTVTSTGDGMGEMSIRCIKYNVGAFDTWTPTRTTLRIDMAETNLDLISHNHVTNKNIAKKWLATDEAERHDVDDQYWYRDLKSNHPNESYKTDSDLVEGDEPGAGTGLTALYQVQDSDVIDFCIAYEKGITTFVRFDPVIEKISYWKNPPGISRNGKSFTGGTKSDFSQDIGKFSTPPLTLQGYANTNWFKSRDNWTENADRTWQRTEQWVYTPDGPSSNTGWIYAVATPNE